MVGGVNPPPPLLPPQYPPIPPGALCLQVALLAVATAIYFGYLSGPPALGVTGLLGGGALPATIGGIPLPAVAFAALVAASRCAVWSFEMVSVRSLLFAALGPARLLPLVPQPNNMQAGEIVEVQRGQPCFPLPTSAG